MKQRILVMGGGFAIAQRITEQLQQRGVTAVAIPDLEGLSVGQVSELARELETVSEGGMVGYLPGDLEGKWNYDLRRGFKELLDEDVPVILPVTHTGKRQVSIAPEQRSPDLTDADVLRIQQAQEKRQRRATKRHIC